MSPSFVEFAHAVRAVGENSAAVNTTGTDPHGTDLEPAINPS